MALKNNALTVVKMFTSGAESLAAMPGRNIPGMKARSPKAALPSIAQNFFLIAVNTGNMRSVRRQKKVLASVSMSPTSRSITPS